MRGVLIYRECRARPLRLRILVIVPQLRLTFVIYVSTLYNVGWIRPGLNRFRMVAFFMERLPRVASEGLSLIPPIFPKGPSPRPQVSAGDRVNTRRLATFWTLGMLPPYCNDVCRRSTNEKVFDKLICWMQAPGLEPSYPFLNTEATCNF